MEAVVTAKRDKAAALKFLNRIMKKYGRPLPVEQNVSRTWIRCAESPAYGLLGLSVQH